VARAGAGVNNIPLDRCSELGIVVFNTPGANANAVKELAIAALLLTSRNISEGIQWVKEQAAAGADVAAVVETGKAQFAGVEILGKTLGVVGLGAIGIQVANAAAALGMDVVGYDPYLSVTSALTLDPKVTYLQSLDHLYAVSDYISLHLPMTPETRGSINRETIAKMKPSVRIINLARGELVNDTDMIAALESGLVSSYATDFPNGEITSAKNVIPIPHLGASSEESEENCAVMAAVQIQDYLVNGNIVNSVNMPTLSMGWSAPTRLSVLCSASGDGGPDPVSTITARLAEAGIAPISMSSKIRGHYAYLLADVGQDLPASLLEDLSAMSCVLRARVLTR
jgi:D-3-phosphoglycerate dehydrogenase